ncbi:MAG: acetoin dehydrogenase dihydrolipoyllysine-residue acetyltransferase subunit [Deltaproteobacteria bacterium]|nr:acetoin dehydrogenase dihydrolipoyllysine-residue acetyltransferase subunit [Deltaproteobacteria bacterium]
MSTELRLPRLGETMEEGIVVTWNLSEGEGFERGDTLLEVETDKMVAEVPALESGTLMEILVEEQAKVKVGDILALIDPSEKSSRKIEIPAKTEQAPSQKKPKSPPASYDPTHSFVHDEKDQDHIRAVPGARRIAKRDGIELKAVMGTGPAGRIERSDVDKFFKKEPEGASFEQPFGPQMGPGGVRFLRRGNQSGTPLVLLHGFAADLHSWRLIHGPLSRNRDVIAFELPGHGESKVWQENGGLQALAEHLEQVIIELELGTVDIVGHSLGGAIAVYLASQQTNMVRRLTLLAPVGFGTEINLSAVEPFTEELSESEIKLALSRLFYDLRWISKDLIEATKKNFGSSNRRAQAKDLLKSIFPSGTQEWDGHSLLCKLNQPVRILWGEEDLILPVRHLNGLPGWVAQHRLSKVGHVPQIEAAPLLLRILQADPA